MPVTPLLDGELHVGDVVLLDLDRVGRELAISKRSVQRLIQDGELAALLHGGRRMVTRTELADYVARRAASAAKARSARARARRARS